MADITGMREDTGDYRQLFLQDVPLLDVRAPVEFNRGAFPNATNVPLLDDRQREQIGIRYKHAGQEEAIRLGLELASYGLLVDDLHVYRAIVAQRPIGRVGKACWRTPGSSCPATVEPISKETRS